jgi:hypothetical protein
MKGFKAHEELFGALVFIGLGLGLAGECILMFLGLGLVMFWGLALILSLSITYPLAFLELWLLLRRSKA